MQRNALLFFAFFLPLLRHSFGDDHENIFPCGKVGKLTRFQVIPGGGWDNLRNIEMSAVFVPNYNSCSITMDGRFFLPLHVDLLPKGQSSMKIFSEVFDHYYRYKSITASSINVDAGLNGLSVGISGSFSHQHQHTRVTQLEGKSITTRVSLRQALYTVLKNPSMPLSPSFHRRLREVGFQLRQNATDMASYLADMIVADYGTHFITRMDAGGLLWKQDAIKCSMKSLSERDVNRIKIAAAVSFASVFRVSAGWSHTVDKQTMQRYQSNQTDSRIHGEGGKSVRPNLTIDDWSNSLYKNLVPVDRAGDPIHFAVTTDNLKKMSYQLVDEVRHELEQAVKRYYSANTVKGCLSRYSPNFNPLANVPSEDCSERKFNFTFGGVYQTCTGDSGLCIGHSVANIITGGTSCSKEYIPVLLHRRMFSCRHFCSGIWFWRECHTYCATYSIFWCAAGKKGIKQETGYLFGGLYSKRAANPVTGQKSCPDSFLAFSLGAGDFNLCLSRDFGGQMENAVSFGGFFSCHAGNPYLVLPADDTTSVGYDSRLVSYVFQGGPKQWPMSCPKGFQQHLAYIDGNCEIMYCAVSELWSAFTPITPHLPPFTQLPKGSVAPPMPPDEINIEIATSESKGNGESRIGSLRAAVIFLTVALAIVSITAIVGAVFVRRKFLELRKQNEQSPLLGQSS